MLGTKVLVSIGMVPGMYQATISLYINHCRVVPGVLWHGATVIEGAAETIQKLQSMGKDIFYLTNNSTKSRDEYVAKCTAMGFPAQKASIISSAYVAAQHIKRLGYTGKVFNVGSRGIEQELQAVGLQSVGAGPDNIDGMGFEEMCKMKLDPDIRCVVVGMDTHFSYLKMARAISYLAREGCHFVATNSDSGLPTGGGTFLPGTGSILAAVETAAQRKADVICGKPNSPIFDVLMETHNVNPGRTLMIGDRMNTDIELAGRCGLHSLLVLSGVSQMADVERLIERGEEADRHQIPEYCVESLGEIGKLIAAEGL